MYTASSGLTEFSRYKGYYMFDEETKTLDKDAFDYLLNLEVKKAARYLYFFSLMVLQKDKTSLILSLPEEDVLIKRLASLVKEEVRGTDIIGRIADDRFFILLDQADFQSSFKVGVRVKDRIENYAFKADGRHIRMTTSIGIACFPTHGSDIVTLRNKADFALKMAIEGGGSKVCLPR